MRIETEIKKENIDILKNQKEFELQLEFLKKNNIHIIEKDEKFIFSCTIKSLNKIIMNYYLKETRSGYLFDYIYKKLN